MGSTTKYQELNCCREGTSIGVKETIKYTEEMRDRWREGASGSE